MSINIQELIPHRPPFLLVDEVVSIAGVGLTPDHVARGTKHRGRAYLECGYCPKREKRVDGLVGLEAEGPGLAFVRNTTVYIDHVDAIGPAGISLFRSVIKSIDHGRKSLVNSAE